MNKRVILVTGTPCVGKTSVAQQLTAELNAFYINLTKFAEKHRLTLGEDKERKTIIVDEEKMRAKISETIEKTKKPNIIVDGHYAYAVVPKHYATHIFVLRRNPIELRKIMEKCGFQLEGTMREAMLKHNRRHNFMSYGLLRKEYNQAKQLKAKNVSNR